MNEIVARYLLDRADQYQTVSAAWSALSEAAEAIMKGAHIKAFMAGELDDDDLVQRIRLLGRLP